MNTLKAFVGVAYLAIHIVAAASHAGGQTQLIPPASTQGEWRAPFTLAQPEHRYLITEDMPEWNCATMGNGICGGN